MKLSVLRLYLFIASTLVLFSCDKLYDDFKPGKDKQDTKDKTYQGPEVRVGNGHAYTFITISHTGAPKEIGIIFTDKALTGLPVTNTPYVLELPKKALKTTPFEHLSLGWSANGHPLPNNAFIGPHMDIRFFMTSLEKRLAIPAPPSPGFTNLPSPGYMPANYAPFLSVVALGNHWTDQSFTAGIPVNHTMILGTYDGLFTFISPIVTQTALASGQSFSIPYAQPQSFAEHTYYPTKYNIYYDKQLHYVTLSDFVLR